MTKLYLVRIYQVDELTGQPIRMMHKLYKLKRWADRLVDEYSYEPNYEVFIDEIDQDYDEIPVSDIFDWVDVK